ncbi:MAG: LLM class flavin-dependent oxidoreductase [Chloroflexi bacterium]|nr:LLM class flavin-dependent oxidoreductase [Chloroflexota bacterium]
MHFDVEFNSGAFYPAAGTVELAELAEERGFGAVWKGESNSTDPLVLLSAMAARTRTIKLGTAVYHVFGRSPITLGIQAATINDLSDGRLLLGLGVANRNIAGWHEGTFDRPLRRVREYVEIVRAVATGERVEYHGELYQPGPFKLSWRPRHPRVPVYLAGLGEQMTRLAGRLAEGIIVNMANPARVRHIVSNVRQGAVEAGRDPAQLEFIVKVRCCVNPDREVARRRLKQVLTFYNLADYYRDMIAQMGFAEDSARIREQYQSGGFKAAMAAVTDRLLDGLPLVGATSADEVQERVAPYLEAGATRLILPYVPATEDTIGETKAFLGQWRL